MGLSIKVSDLNLLHKAQLLALDSLGCADCIRAASRQAKNPDDLIGMSHHLAYTKLIKSGLSDKEVTLMMTDKRQEWHKKLMNNGAELDRKLAGLL